MSRDSSRQIKSDARLRILDAARALAAEKGPGSISIEGVAARAGLSKGGVLYHFHTKSELLAALVARHIEHSRDLVEQRLSCSGACSNAVAEALLDAHLRDDRTPVPPASGVLAAIAENPDLLDPLHEHQAQLLARLKNDPGDAELATIVFLALEGLKAMRLFGFGQLDNAEEGALIERMRTMLREGC